MLKTYIESLGLDKVKACIEDLAGLYPKTAVILEDNPILSCELGMHYENMEGLDEEKVYALPVDLRLNMCELMNVLQNMEQDLLIYQADHLCIYKGPFLIVRITNSHKPNSGRSISIDMDRLCSRLEVELQLKKSQGIASVVDLVMNSVYLGVFAYGVFTIYKNF